MTDQESPCPACGQPISYCQGHGSLGDWAGAIILEKHDDGEHADCHRLSDCRRCDWCGDDPYAEFHEMTCGP